MATPAPEPTGSIATALAHTARLLGPQPQLAAEQARAILEAAPGHAQARLFLGIAQRRSGEVAAALATLAALARVAPGNADVVFEYGITLAEAGRGDQARAALTEATRLRPGHAEAWRALGDQHLLAGDSEAADAAYALQIRASVTEPQLLQAAAALGDGKLAVAEALLRTYLKEKPADAAAIRMFAEVAARLGRLGDAETLLARCLEIAPGFVAARNNYASVLHRANKSEAALEQIDQLLARDPRNPGMRNLKAAVLARIGQFEGAIELYASVLVDYPQQPKAWMSYGHTLKTVGRLADSITAYRTATLQAPQLGEVWWSLANLKTFRFTDADVAAMQAQLARDDISDEDRFHLDFALGKAFEDAKAYEPSFAHYAKANALRRQSIHYDADEISGHVARSKAFFTPAFFAARASQGCPARDPIFVVGLPRAGSTLIEQILSSHSQIEGTTELPDIIATANRIGERKQRGAVSLYPEALADLGADEIAALGLAYLDSTRIQRQTDRPLFIDKMPNNFLHIGLIATILPNAKIIDARRHPMGGGFAAYKQHFARGQNFSYSLEDLGRYYGDYVALMAHYDKVLPRRIHRVFYEDMVGDSETQIRALLDYLGLPFEAACLSFHETERAVRTPSSEQVRQPIYTAGVELWQHYDKWLGPLRATLGSVLDSYPAVPFDE